MDQIKTLILDLVEMASGDLGACVQEPDLDHGLAGRMCALNILSQAGLTDRVYSSEDWLALLKKNWKIEHGNLYRGTMGLIWGAGESCGWDLSVACCSQISRMYGDIVSRYINVNRKEKNNPSLSGGVAGCLLIDPRFEVDRVMNEAVAELVKQLFDEAIVRQNGLIWVTPTCSYADKVTKSYGDYIINFDVLHGQTGICVALLKSLKFSKDDPERVLGAISDCLTHHWEIVKSRVTSRKVFPHSITSSGGIWQESQSIVGGDLPVFYNCMCLASSLGQRELQKKFLDVVLMRLKKYKAPYECEDLSLLTGQTGQALIAYLFYKATGKKCFNEILQAILRRIVKRYMHDSYHNAQRFMARKQIFGEVEPVGGVGGFLSGALGAALALAYIAGFVRSGTWLNALGLYSAGSDWKKELN